VTRRFDELLDEFLREVGEDAAAIDGLAGGGSPAPAPPSRELRDRLLAETKKGGRFERFTDQVARLLDLDSAEAEKLLDGIDDPRSWGPGLMPGMDLYHVAGGPKVQNAITGFIRVAAGAEFPTHKHLGDEHVLVLQGHYVDEDGSEVGPGDVVSKRPDTSHSFKIVGGPDLLYLAVIHGGVEVLGETITPDDPRM
jgi:quercetin dioxygenase-like cupin family protein